MSSCQRSLGASAQKRCQLLLAVVRLGGDEPAGGQGPPDRQHRGDRVGTVTVLEVGGDGRRTGFVAVPVEVPAQFYDLVLGRLRGAPRAAVRAA